MGGGENEIIYYGTLTEIIKITYGVYSSHPNCVFLFNCLWYDGDRAVKVKKNGSC